MRMVTFMVRQRKVVLVPHSLSSVQSGADMRVEVQLRLS
jgi:hypothetical protein